MSKSQPIPATNSTNELPITTISSQSTSQFIQGLKDLLEYRELFLAFVTRSVKIKYKQTILGVVWVILQPLITGVVFSAIFGLITGRFDGITGLLFFMSGLVPWTSFQQGTQMASQSLESNANLVSKVYFPRMTVPASEVIASLVDFSIAFTTMLIIAAIAGAFNPMILLWMPPLLLIQVMTAIGLGLIFSIINAQYRDIKYAIPFILQLGMFITVLIPFPLSALKNGDFAISAEKLWMAPYVYTALSFNPMAAVIDTYRSVLNGTPLNFDLLIKGTLVSVALLLIGMRFFNKRERRLVDIL